MVKFTDPTFPENYFIIIEDHIYTVEKNRLNLLLEALENNDALVVSNYDFKLSELDPEEQHFQTIFDKLNTPYIKLLFHE